SMHYITQESAASSPGVIPSQAHTAMEFDIPATGDNMVLSWGGHIASRLDWGFLNGTPLSAGGISGSPYHTNEEGACNTAKLTSPCTDGGSQDRSLQAAAVAPPPVTPDVTTDLRRADNSSI